MYLAAIIFFRVGRISVLLLLVESRDFTLRQVSRWFPGIVRATNLLTTDWKLKRNLRAEADPSDEILRSLSAHSFHIKKFLDFEFAFGIFLFLVFWLVFFKFFLSSARNFINY